MTSTNPFEEIDRKLDKIQSDLDVIKSKPDLDPPDLERFLTTDQFCEVLGISRVTLWSWDKKGITQPLRFGNLKRYRQSDIENLGRRVSK